MYDNQSLEESYKQHQKDLSLLEYGEGIALTPDALEDNNEDLSLPPVDHTDRFLFKDDNIGKNVVLSGDIIYEFLMGCESLESLDLTSFNLIKKPKMYNIFKNCSSLVSIDFSNTKISNLSFESYHFTGCSSLKTILINIEGMKVNGFKLIVKNI
jgi:hypothetical protein